MFLVQECRSCFLKQGERAAKILAPDDPERASELNSLWESSYEASVRDCTPPSLCADLYEALARETGVTDPFREQKRESNDRLLAMRDELGAHIERSDDRLRTALGLSVIGNYIDAGVAHGMDWEAEIAAFCGRNGGPGPLDGPDYDAFAGHVGEGSRVLILGDNCGEIVLDTLLVRELVQLGCDVTFAVRESPILNDATMEDAEYVGMTDLCRVVSSGVNTPGTELSRCSPEFLERMRGADVILSKGQGNFECLLGNRPDGWPDIFFAFKAKCSPVAGMLEVPRGTSVFRRYG